MAAAEAKLKIIGTQLPIHLALAADHLVRTLKSMILYNYGVPIHRQTLHVFNSGQLMADDQTLQDYGITNGQRVHYLQLSVEPGPPDATIMVGLRSRQPQFAMWRAVVRCKETSTLAEFKRLIADQLRWAEPDGMRIYRGGYGGPIDEEGNMDRIIRDFLIMQSTVLWVEFTTNVPQNGVRPHQIAPPPGPAAM